MTCKLKCLILLIYYFFCDSLVLADCVEYGNGSGSIHVGDKLPPSCDTEDGCVLCDTIQDGANAASQSRAVTIESGLYFGIGNINITAHDTSFIAAENASVTIDCENSGFGFALYVSPSTQVRVSGVEIRQCSGYAVESHKRYIYYGGAISVFLDNSTFVGAQLRIHHCSLPFSNKADKSFGGGMHVSGYGRVDIEDSIFYSNEADNGGALSINFSDQSVGRSLSILRTKFVDNVAIALGGAVTLENVNGVVADALIQGNEAGSGGGLILESSSVDFVRSKFVGNRASHGAGLLLASHKGYVTSCVFEGNTATTAAGILLYYMVYTTIQGCNFVRNEASDKGGALGAFTMVGDVSVDDCIFDSNYAENGGAVRFDFAEPIEMSPDYPWWITNSDFLNNTAVSAGAGMYITQLAYIMVVNCTFQGQLQRVATSEFLKGGAVAMEGETVFVGFIDTRFEGNLAKAGGAVYCEESYLLVENTTVHNSTCPVCVDSTADSSSSICSCGASVYVVEDCVLHLSDSVLQKNVGGIYAHDASLFVRSSEFVDNTMAQTPGGAAILAISSNVEISDSEFLGMSASGGFGGAVYAKGEAITILNSNFRENKAGKGGAVVVESMNDGDIVISGCCFEKNRGTHLGGALYFETAENMVVLNTEFRNNYAGDAVSRPILRHHGGGGAIACKAGNSRLRIEDCTFERNHALLGLDDVSAGDGGALSMLFDVKLSVVGSTFLDNIADRFGGGIYLGTYGATVISNCTIQGNHAVDGGGIAIFSQVIFENVYVAQNNASNNGGGIAIHSAILNLLLGSQTRVVGNIAQQNGGGISMLSSTIHIQRPEEGYFTCESCSPGSVGNGHCDPECFARACQWDAGDCMTRFANPVPVGGSEVVCECEINNGECDASCFRLECSFDGHDCDDVAHVDIMSCPHFLNNYFKALEASPVQFAEEGGICILPTQVGSLSFDECATGHTLELQWYRYYNCSAVSAEDDVPSWDDYPTDLPPEIWETQCDGGGYLMSYKDAIRNVRNSTVYDSTFLRGKISWTKSFDFSDAVLVRAQGVYTVPEGKGGSYEFAAIASGEIYVYVVPEEDGTFTDVSPEHLLLKPSATSTLSVSPTWDNPTDIVRRFTNLKAGVRYLFVIDMFDVYTTSTFFELGRKYPGDELRYAPSGTEYFSPRDTLDHSDDPWCVTRDLSSDGERETWGTCTDDVFVFSRGNVNMEETWAALETELDELEYMGKCFEAPLILSHNEAASGYGGGLYMGSCTSNDVLCFVNPPYNPPSMTVVFTDNYAFFAGGGMFVQCHEMSTPCIDSMMTLSPVNISSWYFHGNRADGYGFDYASGASTLDVVMGDVILRYFSGDVLQGTFRILDYFKQVIRAPLGDLHPYILRTLLCVGEEGCLSTANLVSVEHHRFAEDGLSRLNESQHVVTFSAEDNVVDPELSLMALVVNEDLVESLTFPISREACPAGTQKLLSSTPLGRQSELCITCEYSTYSFIKDSSSCHPCPAGATCPGGWQINADKSYWSPCRNVFDMDTCRHSDGEIELWKCPKEGGCLAGSENVIMECDTAYLEDSRLCSRCRFGYWMFQHQCYRCHSTSLNVFNVVVIVLVLFWLPLARWAAVNFPFLYIALTYFQLLSITSEFNIDWPNRFRTFIQSFSLLNFDISISQAECFLADDQYFLITFLLYMSLPVIYGWLFFGRPQLLRLYAAMTSGGRNIALHSGEGFLQRTMRPATEEEIKEAKGMALHTFLFTVNQLYLSCITKAFQIFLCATFKDNDHYYLVVSPEVECKGDSYFLMFAVAISALFVYLLGVPSLFVWIVGVYGKARRHPSHPDHESFKRRFGFLYARFDPDFYWWEMMTICRKLGFSIFRTFFQYDSLLQTSLCMLLTVAAIMMQYAFRPFVLQRWNVLECATLASVFSVLLLAHMYNYSSTASYSAGTALGEMLGFAAVMTGLGSVFVVGWLDVRAYMQKKIVPIRIPSTSNKNIFSPSQTRQGGVWTTKGGCKTDRKASRYLASTAEDSTCID